MITLFILFDFLNSLSHFQMALLGLVPLFLVIATLLLNIFLRRKETAGFVCNGSVLMMWYFVIYLASVFAQYSVKWLPKDWVGKDSIFDTVHKDGVPDNSILWYLLAATIAYFICYFFIAFRPVTQDQLQLAKAKKKIVLEMSSEAVGNASSRRFVDHHYHIGYCCSLWFIHVALWLPWCPGAWRIPAAYSGRRSSLRYPVPDVRLYPHCLGPLRLEVLEEYPRRPLWS